MVIFKRFLPFVRPHMPRLLLAGLLVAGVALINLTLVRLAGTLWDIITVQHDADKMTRSIGLFLGLVILQGSARWAIVISPPGSPRPSWLIFANIFSVTSKS
ncbi:MAG: hypothetical protein U0236_04805 [Nitrospira sp.]